MSGSPFKGTTCRGSYRLGTACGYCERCERERAGLEMPPPPPAEPAVMDIVGRLTKAIEQAVAGMELFVAGLNAAAPKFCRDCKWCRYPGVAVSVCTHDKALEPAVNVVSGEPGQSTLYCINMRMVVGAPCGIEARLFEAREATKS